MSDPRFQNLVEQVRTGAIDRRTFIVRAVAVGASSLAIGSVLTNSALAQDASPEAVAGELGPETLGVPGVAHITDTSKGNINIYSSWPMTGSSEQIGSDGVAAVKFAARALGWCRRRLHH